jgi:hypothetical protein
MFDTMGEAKQRAERIIHKQKLLGGRMTAEELWRESLNGVCGFCGGPPAMQIYILLPLEDFLRDHPQIAIRKAAQHEGRIPVVIFRGPDGGQRRFTQALHAFACDLHKVGLERFAAKAPSYAVVHIDKGPPDMNRIQVGAGD